MVPNRKMLCTLLLKHQ